MKHLWETTHQGGNAMRTTITVAILLVALILTGCSGSDCPTSPGPIVPPTPGHTTSLVFGETQFEELSGQIEYWNPDTAPGGNYQVTAEDSWNDESVTVNAIFDPEYLHTVSSTAPLGCDLIHVNGVPIGATDAQLTAAFGDMLGGDTWETDTLRIQRLLIGDGRVVLYFWRL
ncbi:MAG: hypothetical protein GY906_28345 [bacterium]|nr:hypothetical protein [bacterium]